jgi:hypothetical protein
MTTYTITNIDYSGHDFCGEIPAHEVVKIIDAQPKSFTITHNNLYDDIFEEVSDFFYENGILTPTSFYIDGIKCDDYDQVFIQQLRIKNSLETILPE